VHTTPSGFPVELADQRIDRVNTTSDQTCHTYQYISDETDRADLFTMEATAHHLDQHLLPVGGRIYGNNKHFVYLPFLPDAGSATSFVR
jgi:hypothetical protein